MSMFDSAKDKAQEAMKDNPDKAEQLSDQGLERGGDALNDATGGKFGDQIDKGEEAADAKVGDSGDQGGDQAQ